MTARRCATASRLAAGPTTSEMLLNHISQLRWEHIKLTGIFTGKTSRRIEELRSYWPAGGLPLRFKNHRVRATTDIPSTLQRKVARAL